MNPTLRALIPLTVLALLSGCTRNPTVIQKTSPEIVEVFVPQAVHLADSVGVLFHARVDDPQGVEDITSVTCRAWRPDGSGQEFAMRDDGRDGDIIASDGQFVVRIPGYVWGGEGEGKVTFLAVDREGNQATSDTLSLTILPGKRGAVPRILSLQFADTLFADSTYQVPLLVRVHDNDGLADLQSVQYWVFPPGRATPAFQGLLEDDGTIDDGVPGNGVYGRRFSSDGFGIERGIYTLIVRALDQSDNWSPARLKYFVVKTSLENLPPRVEAVIAPDSVSRSQTGPFVIAARVSDPNGLADIARVFFNSFLPDGTPAGGNPFFLRDDGRKDQNGLGDAIANDGVYSIVVQVGPTSQLGTYRFEFQAEDRGGLLSEKVIHTITVLQ